jgi:hypothetical protein
MPHVHRAVVLVLLIVCLGNSASTAHAQCNIPPGTQATLAQLPQRLRGFDLAQQQGLIYMDARCFDQARSYFRQALNELPSESLSDSQLRLQTLANSLIQLTNGYEAWARGDLGEAEKIFDGASDESGPLIVNQRSIYALSELLLGEPDPELWKHLEPKLRIFEKNNFWRAHRCLLEYGLNPGNAPSRISSIETTLSGDVNVQTRLQNEIILAEILLQSGRVAEASVLTKDIERDVGRKAIDIDLRLGYLALCLALAEEQSKHGDQEAAARAHWLRSEMGGIYANR